MVVLITAGVILGAALGRSFKVSILGPACFIIVVLFLINAGRLDFTFLHLLGKTGLLIISLELGYLAGLISTDLVAARQGFRSLWLRARGMHTPHQAHLR